MERKDSRVCAAAAFWGRIRGESLGCLLVGSGCCAASALRALSAAPACRLRLRLEGSPERAHILVVAGRISVKSCPRIVEAYRKMEEPRWVAAIGSCAGSGGLSATYSVLAGIGELLPVDLFVPGCPPQAEAMLRALADVAGCAGRGPRGSGTRRRRVPWP